MADQFIEIKLEENIQIDDNDYTGGLHWSTSLDIPDGATIVFKDNKPFIYWDDGKPDSQDK